MTDADLRAALLALAEVWDDQTAMDDQSAYDWTLGMAAARKDCADELRELLEATHD